MSGSNVPSKLEPPQSLAHFRPFSRFFAFVISFLTIEPDCRHINTSRALKSASRREVAVIYGCHHHQHSDGSKNKCVSWNRFLGTSKPKCRKRFPRCGLWNVQNLGTRADLWIFVRQERKFHSVACAIIWPSIRSFYKSKVLPLAC